MKRLHYKILESLNQQVRTYENLYELLSFDSADIDLAVASMVGEDLVHIRTDRDRPTLVLISHEGWDQLRKEKRRYDRQEDYDSQNNRQEAVRAQKAQPK